MGMTRPLLRQLSYSGLNVRNIRRRLNIIHINHVIWLRAYNLPPEVVTIVCSRNYTFLGMLRMCQFHKAVKVQKIRAKI